MKKRVVEAFVGEYASGKSEVAVNRALDLKKKDPYKKVNLVDLDTVEPCYTLRPIKKELEAKGLNVIAWETNETVGLGEAGSVIKGAMRWALKNEGHVILDIGYGVHGSKILNLIEGAEDDLDLLVICVLNISRPSTRKLSDILEYLQEIGRIDALLNNTHLDSETTVDVVQEGAKVVYEVANILQIKYLGSVAVQEIADKIGKKDIMGFPVKIIKRYMPKTFW